MTSKTNWKIVVVDDDPTVHKLIQKILPSPRFETYGIQDASKAFEEIKKLRPHLVILDLMMPRLSGMELCQLIKKNEETKKTIVLILSAKENQDDRIKGLEYGADDYISKPFHLASLARKIEYMLTVKPRNSIIDDRSSRF